MTAMGIGGLAAKSSGIAAWLGQAAQRLAPQAARAGWTAAAALVLAGCQVVPKVVDAPPPVVVAPPPVAPGLPVDLDRHRVALLVPQTGPNADVGTSIANATTLALLDSRSERVRITTYDTALGAGAAAAQAIADGNRLILGPLLSEDVAAVAAVARGARVPVISFSNDVTVAGNGVFVMGAAPGQSVERVVAFAKAQGLRRFGALVPNSAYGNQAAAVLRAAFPRNDAASLRLERYDRTATAMTGATRRLASGGDLDAVLIADSSANSIRVVPLLPAGGTRILGTELWNSDTNLAATPALRGAWYASVSDGLYRQLATKYRARYGKPPFRLASLGYDAVLLTVRIGRDWKPGTNFPTDALLARDGFGGIDGIFRFGANGVAQRALEVTEVAAPTSRVADPAPTRW